MNREPNYKIAYHAQTAMNNIFHDIVSLFTLGSIYSTKASEAERITETNTNLYVTMPTGIYLLKSRFMY